MSNRRLPKLLSGRRGGQKVEIDQEKLEHLLSIGFSVTTIANDGLLGAKVHRNTISNFMKTERMVMPRHRFSNISDSDLNDEVLRIHQNFPNSGYREVKSFLESQNPPLKLQRERVRQSLKYVDPVGTAERWNYAIRRRAYKVPTPNFL